MRFSLLLTTFAAVLFCALPAAAQEPLIQTIAREAIVLDADTGTVLLEKNADQRMPTSSMSKTMTMYVVFDMLKKGQLSENTSFTVSEKAWKMEGSKMFVEVGKQVTVGDLMRGVIIQSGNDATVVLAEGISGSEMAFAENLNKKAAELGMTNSHFTNASGLPDPQHYSTARDLATLATHLIRDFPEYYPLFAEKEFTYNKIKQGNRNPLLYKNIGADGVKTGHAQEAGYGVIGSGVLGNRRVVVVVNGLVDDKERAAESAKLLEWGLKNFQTRELFKANATVAEAKVVMGDADKVPLVIKDRLALTLPTASASNIKATAVFKEPLIAPVEPGAQVGILKLEIPHMPVSEVPLYAGAGVNKLGLFAGMVAKARLMVTGG